VPSSVPGARSPCLVQAAHPCTLCREVVAEAGKALAGKVPASEMLASEVLASEVLVSKLFSHSG
jgi:hypothetical protein